MIFDFPRTKLERSDTNPVPQLWSSPYLLDTVHLFTSGFQQRGMFNVSFSYDYRIRVLIRHCNSQNEGFFAFLVVPSFA